MFNAEALAFTIREFAERTRAGESTVRLRIAQGRLRAVKDGKVTRILHADAEAYPAALPAVTPRNPTP